MELYTGVTSDLVKRVSEHKSGKSQFTEKYNVSYLIWFEEYLDVEQAIQRERQLKRWKREWKIRLIETTNPSWADLFPNLNGCLPSQA